MHERGPDPAPDWPGFARRVIEAALCAAPPTEVAPPRQTAAAHGGVFVTLHKGGRLRGCMGTLDPTLSIPDAIRHAARVAALEDPRFPPVTADELPDARIDVSILSTPWPMRTLDDLELGRHGIIVQQGPRRGLFLPQVATDHGLSKEKFLSCCCVEKAGLPPDAWKDPDTAVLLFTTQMFREGEPAAPEP